MDEKKIEEVMLLVRSHREDWYEYLTCSDASLPRIQKLMRQSEKEIEYRLRQLIGEQHG